MALEAVQARAGHLSIESTRVYLGLPPPKAVVTYTQVCPPLSPIERSPLVHPVEPSLTYKH
jgi:hypothetical protein